MKDLALGARTLRLRLRLVYAAWLLHLAFAFLAAWFPCTQILASLAHRPAASAAFLRGFDFEMLADWLAAYGKPVTAYWSAAVMLAAAYGVATALLEAVILPVWLSPFERRRSASQALSALVIPTLGGLVIWAVLLTLFRTLWLLPAVFLLRIVLNLWKCASVSGAGGLDALLVALRRFGSVAALALATLAGTLLYAVMAAAAGWLALASAQVIPLVVLEQGVLLVAVVLRLWLLASTVVLWRRVRPELELV